MSYFNVSAVPPTPPASYAAAPERAKPPAATQPTPQGAAQSSYGPAVVLGGSLAKPPERRAPQAPEPPKPAHHVDRVI
ncbi:hypothetical protein [Phenylobacterium sp.]|jgi:hypothetical protein|uniref:hypothetical protein n=1 Tax=Phenylobacterium sp. TaxID=1871053 RepID=UPI002E307DDD|nr:hypothetical protein [Phenylobacterium sp.]HEX4709424.1 hypothetical protein [Phenylobacterium sp.]